MVYGSKLMIETENEQNENKAILKATVYNVDLSKVNSGEGSDVKGNPSVNQKVSLKTVKSWTEKQQEGTYYDYIEKVTRPRYTYSRREEVIDQKELTTNDQGKLDYNFPMETG